MSGIALLLKRILMILLLFTASRLIFFIFNFSYFRPLQFNQLWRSFFYGIRFDFVVIYYINSLFIIAHLIPLNFCRRIIVHPAFRIFMIVVNAILLIGNFIDIGYFGYTSRRSGYETLKALLISSDTLGLLPKYVANYWHLALLWFGFLLMMIKWFPKNQPDLGKPISSFKNRKWLPALVSFFLLFGGLAIARGFEVKPIRIISAHKYVTPSYIPLLLNTPFTLLNSINQYTASPKDYFSEEELSHYFQANQHFSRKEGFRNKNVVIIILESFGKEYTEALSADGRSYTPFLDSLIHEGLYCSNAFSNGYNTIDALPAIIGGFPSLLNTSYISSVYSGNTIRGLGSILQEKGYSTGFYHGGKNGTMGFDLFTRAAGLEDYYGLTEFGNMDFFDGAWGIWDEHFLQYTAKNLDNRSQPFMAVLFTLSSHDPYQVPAEYDTLFPGDSQILRAVAYTDHSLKKFFQTASRMSWYDNTIFVLLADHTSVSVTKKISSPYTHVQIPILYFAPGDTSVAGKYDKVTQQLDIMPSVLDYLRYRGRFVSFGKSVFSDPSGYRFAVSYKQSFYQMIDSSFCLFFDGSETMFMGKYEEDISLKTDVHKDFPAERFMMENYLKAFLQDYYSRLDQNGLGDTTLFFNGDDKQ